MLRSVLFQIYFAVLSVAMCLGFTPAFLGPWPWAARGVEYWGRATLWGLRVICGLTYEVRGREHIMAGPALYAGKHLAMWDTVVLPVILKNPALVLKRQLLRVPFYGWYALKSGMIALDRSAHATAVRSLVAQAKARRAEGRPIAIFPEGTRRKIGAPPAYKPGVAALYGQLDIPCVPFGLNSSVYWTGALRRPGRIVIEFLPPIPPGLKRREFMAALETQIETSTAALVAEARGA
ncbi:MAG: 1-acyl-sn-glycerol-3-phosphate acyltransferase [Alphaproteobacteria bacterium]|nr:1-acyl-sn-glycerol-3-phosphate acyltransferase [Alphaproteobacteria bacterium]